MVWAIVERLHIYLYVANSKLYTDCKPIELLFGNRGSKPSARIERFSLETDFLSCHTSNAAVNTFKNSAEEYVSFLANHAVSKAMALQQIKIATKQDETLQKVMELIKNENWHCVNTSEFINNNVSANVNIADIKSFRNRKDELTVNSD